MAWFCALPGPWELKCSGGEAFAHPLFLDFVVPALMERSSHWLSVLTNFSASREELSAFAALTRGRLRVFSASLHLESVAAEDFVDKARWFVAEIGAATFPRKKANTGDTPTDVSPDVVWDTKQPGPHFVVNQVVLPGKEEEAARCKKLVEAAGLRWFPQLYKTKQGVATYPDPGALAVLIGKNPSPKQANLSPSYFGRRCEAGRRYGVVDKDGALWSCRSAKRNSDGYLGNIFDGTAKLWTQVRRCPFDRCPCTVPANRGMIEGIP
jgi:hypothetical protein